MPYHAPHRPIRDRIVDLEIMKLELRKSSRPEALRDGQARTTARRARSARRVA